MFLTKKIDGRIKITVCADGRGQRITFEKEDAASPTVANENIFITSAIDPHERTDVATINISGTFLHADSDEHIIVVLKVKLALLICHVYPKLYRKYIIFDKRGKPVLLVKFFKSLYGLLQSVMLFYHKLVKDLQKYGLKVNPYDPCVFNGTKNGEQLLVTFLDGDLK